MRVKSVLVVAAAASLIGVAVSAPAASASPSAASRYPFGAPKDIATGLVTPLSMAVDKAGNAYVAQNFAGQLTKVTAAGATSSLFSAPPGQEVGAVSERNGTVYFALDDQGAGKGLLMSVPAAGGNPVTVGDVGAYERTANPDAGVTYGFIGIDPACAAQIPAEAPPGQYTGVVDTHPYASAADASGVYVADAAGNDIVKVGYNGAVSTVAVIPPAPPIRVTAELATAQGYPACVADYPFVAESVPTDVEFGPGGWLYVSTLPGGPEDPSLGARGSVYKVNPRSGKVLPVATGFAGATGLAVSPLLGVVFVTELFGGAQHTGQVSVVLPGFRTPTASVPVNSPAAIELSGGKVYVSRDAVVFGETGPQPIGKVTVVPLFGRFD